jgi:hypothetical protein
VARRTTRTPEPRGPDWPPEKTLRVLKQQREELKQFKGRNYREIENELRTWDQFTVSVLTHGFGEDSTNETNFVRARSAGQWRIGGMPEAQIQRNYQLRIELYEAALNSSIKELEFMLPEQELQGAYQPGDEYAFYKDLKSILATARTDVLIVDNYLDTGIFEIYVETIELGIKVRILTDQPRGNLVLIAQKYSSRGSFELKGSKEVHDRVVFVDERCWVVGQSIKDAARTKPTYIIEFDAQRMQPIYEDIWMRATTLVKS